MENFPFACISIIAPDGSPIYLRKYQNSTANPTSSQQNDDLEIESLIFSSLLAIKKQNIFLNIRTLAPPVQSHVFPVPVNSRSSLSVYTARFPLKYTLILVTTRKLMNESSYQKLSCMIADELFGRIADPFYSPFSPLDKSEQFNTNIDKIIHSQPV